MSKKLPSDSNLTPTRFDFHRLDFIPYVEDASTFTSRSIVKAAFQHLTDELRAGRGHLQDRTKGRKGVMPRSLFMTIPSLHPHKNRIFGTLVLVRAGKLPKFKLPEENKLENIDRDVVEATNFYIDYSHGYNVVCLEFNPSGPRLSDLEWYLRYMVNTITRLAKSVAMVTFMKSTLGEAINSFANTLSFKIKTNPKLLSQVDAVVQGYMTDVTNFSRRVGSRHIKVEALFQAQGKAIKQTENKEANSMMKYLFKSFNDNPENLNGFEHFSVVYEDKDGADHLLDLMESKEGFEVEIDHKKVSKRREIYDLIEGEFDTFMQSLPNA